MNNLRKQHSDFWLSLAVFGLIIFGVVMIYSVSKYYSLDLTNNRTDKLFLQKQLLMVAIGLIVWVIFQAIDYRFWKKHISKIFFLMIFLLLLPLILSPFGASYGGRWINLGFSTFQPSELAKLCFIVYLSAWLSDNEKEIGKKSLPMLMIMGFICLLMLAQKDLGTLAIFVFIGAGLFAIAGASITQLATGGIIAAIFAWLAVKIEPYRMERLFTFLNPEANSSAASYHIRNALIAIGSGGLFGLGFGQSKQKYLYLPEAHTDSIFAIICEELGFLRSSVIILIFLFITLRGLKIAKNAPDRFSRLVATGITVWLFSQMFINIGSMMSIVPMTGVPLPFVSSGGTSLIILLAGIGILNNIAKNRVYEKI